MQFQRAFRAVHLLTTNATPDTEDIEQVIILGEPNYAILYGWGMAFESPYVGGGGGGEIEYDGGGDGGGGGELIRGLLWDDAWINPDDPSPPSYLYPNPIMDVITISPESPSDFHSYYPQGSVQAPPHSNVTADWEISFRYISSIASQSFYLILLWGETLI